MRRSITYKVSDSVSHSSGSSDEGIVTFIIFHLHLKDPCRKQKLW